MFSSNASQVSNDANYIEDVFSTWLYTGNGSTQTITNGIDLAGKGGLVWCKERPAPSNHYLIDTVRGVGNNLKSNTTDAQQAVGLNSFTSTGFTTNSFLNDTGSPYASWTFREQPKFFDVVTYTGNGSTQNISHNLGSAPGCIIVKRTDGIENWGVYHRSIGATGALRLNQTAATSTLTAYWNDTEPTSTVFTVGSNSQGNESGGTYVAYLFAHNAGGFGLTGTDNVISCGTYTGTGTAGNAQTLGYEPQWLLIKRTNTATDWLLFDNMRGLPVTASDAQLIPNNSSAETTQDKVNPTATGFALTTDPDVNANGSTYIYIAIRRGPMKVPTDGTSVFAPIARTGTGSATTQETGLNGTDLAFTLPRTAAGNNWIWVDRLRGGAAGSAARIQSNNTSQEFADQSMSVLSSTQTTISYGGGGSNGSGVSYIVECFKRAPGFFDEVCYTGTGSATTVAHNLAAVPELMIVKSRSTVNSWPVWNPDVFAIDSAYITLLNSTIAVSNSGTSFNSTAPTSTVFTVGTNANTNGSGVTYVAYLFSSCPGVSKVGSYTGTGTTQQINCGFTGGARFVLIKRIASAGGAPAGADWYVWDSARGIVAGNDPYLLLNSTAAEVTSTDYVDTYSAGFEISSTAPAEINASGGTFIFLAIA